MKARLVKLLDFLASRLGLATDQESHWQRTSYRGPADPIFLAYAEPKLELIQRIIDLEGKSVLDVGCGPGNFTRLLARRAARVVGCDSSDRMLSRRAEAAGVEILRADARRLPFPDSSFDVVFAANLLHHLDDPAAALAQMRRVAREAVALIEPNALNPVMFGFSLLVPAERGGLRSTSGYLERLLRGAGLRVKRIWTTGMISQNHTPGFLLPLLRRFDFDFPLGEYHVLVAEPVPPP